MRSFLHLSFVASAALLLLATGPAWTQQARAQADSATNTIYALPGIADALSNRGGADDRSRLIDKLEAQVKFDLALDTTPFSEMVMRRDDMCVGRLAGGYSEAWVVSNDAADVHKLQRCAPALPTIWNVGGISSKPEDLWQQRSSTSLF